MKAAYDFVRGMSPYPAAWTEFVDSSGKHTVVKLFATEKELCTPVDAVGNVVSDGKTYLKVALFDGYLHLTTLQLAGKKRMAITDFLRGYRPDAELRVE